MQLFEYKGDTFAVIDGHLWVRLSTAQASESPPVEVPVLKKRGRRPGSRPRGAMSDTQRAIREYKPRRKRLGLDAEEAIKQDIAGGLGMADAVKKYDISVGTFYRLKGDLQNRPVVEESVT
jgi:hypothetical protein